jgi:hypothetical protein
MPDTLANKVGFGTGFGLVTVRGGFSLTRVIMLKTHARGVFLGVMLML